MRVCQKIHRLTNIYIYIYIYIYISSCHATSMDFPNSLSLSLSHTHTHTHTLTLSLSLSLSFRLYLSSFPAALQNYILYLCRAVVDFLLFGQHLHVRVKGSIGERHYFSSSAPMSYSSYLDGFRDER